MTQRRFIYLHGFASSPNSLKAQYIAQQFEHIGYTISIPDLNQDDFYALTLTRQIHQIAELVNTTLTPVTLIGSSFGGLTAAWVAERCSTVDQIVLLAPAFRFGAHWLPKLGVDALQAWQQTGVMSVYNYGQKRAVALSYQFVEDLAQYDDTQLQRPIPTLILHGIHDEVIPVGSSQHFAQHRPWVTLRMLDSDHSLGNVTEAIWQSITDFCSLPVQEK